MFQNRSLYNIAIIHLQKEINFQKCITRLFGAKIQKFKTISQCFKIAQKVSFYNIGIIHLQKEIANRLSKVHFADFAHFWRENSNI